MYWRYCSLPQSHWYNLMTGSGFKQLPSLIFTSEMFILLCQIWRYDYDWKHMLILHFVLICQLSVFQVTISDNGISPLVSPNLSGVTTRVVITITDENDVAPAFTERSYRVRLPAMGTSDADVELYRVVAMDPDEGMNADVDYSINKAGKSGGRFKIHPKTGMITSQKAFEAGQQYDVTVSLGAFLSKMSYCQYEINGL